MKRYGFVETKEAPAAKPPAANKKAPAAKPPAANKKAPAAKQPAADADKTADGEGTDNEAPQEP